MGLEDFSGVSEDVGVIVAEEDDPEARVKVDLFLLGVRKKIINVLGPPGDKYRLEIKGGNLESSSDQVVYIVYNRTRVVAGVIGTRTSLDKVSYTPFENLDFLEEEIARAN